MRRSVLLVLAMLLLAVPLPAHADAGPTVLTIEVPASPTVFATVPVTARLSTEAGAPVAGARVSIIQRLVHEWRAVADAETDAEGTVRAEVRVEPGENRLHARFEGTAAWGPSEVTTVVTPHRLASRVRLSGPDRVVDEQSVRLRARWTAEGDRPVAGTGVVWRRLGSGPWTKVRKVRFDEQGRASTTVAPRRDSRWRIVGKGGAWWQRDESGVHRLDNVPPGKPVAYPADAPRPRVKLPRPARAVGGGPNGVVRRIPDGVWRSMVGRSWHRGCPVGRASLRLVKVNFWGYDGYRYRGELVVRSDIARKTVDAFSDLYRERLPVRSMYRVDRFGWSRTLGGADNYRSMASGNTSAFNCRGVVGNPGVRSPHSYGRAVDLNTWENPYHSRTGIVPNAWWASRSHPRIAWRSGSHPVVRIMRENGFRWTYGTADAHHFDG